MGKTGTIYKIENLVNGKVYIGQTVNSVERRWQAHRSMLKRNNHDNFYLQNAWNKYGEDSFVFKVICESDINSLDDIEINLIDKFRKLNKCYNLESGGNAQKELHDTTKIKLSKAVKNLHKTDLEYRQKYLEAKARQVICIDTGEIYISIAEASRELGINYDNIHQVCIGNNNCARGNDGHYYQFAYYEKGVEYKLKKIKNLKTPKAVVCVNTGETFNSTREAAQKTGVGQSHISQCCNGKRRFAGRMENGDWIIWEFEENYNPNKGYAFKKTRVQSKETRNKISAANKISKKNTKKYVARNVKTNETIAFNKVESLTGYLKSLGYSKPDICNVHRCCNGTRKTAYGHKWKYA